MPAPGAFASKLRDGSEAARGGECAGAESEGLDGREEDGIFAGGFSFRIQGLGERQEGEDGGEELHDGVACK
jgi:hypothetical protein